MAKGKVSLTSRTLPVIQSQTTIPVTVGVHESLASMANLGLVMNVDWSLSEWLFPGQLKLGSLAAGWGSPVVMLRRCTQ